MSDGADSRRNMEGGGGGGLPPDNWKCYKCGEGGHFICDCAEFGQVKALGRAFVPSAQTVNPTHMGRPAVASTSIAARRSWSDESGTERGETGDDTNALMREYFLQMAEERRNRVEREAEEEKCRKEEELRQERENKRLLRQEERQRLKAERDARLLRIIRSEMRKDRNEERERYERRGKGVVKAGCRSESIEDEKERLRRLIAPKTIGNTEEEVDDELLALRALAAKLNLTEKRKRGPDLPVGNSPPIVTPEKKSNTKLSGESMARIELLKSEQGADAGTSCTPRKIDLSLKHIVASCGPGGKEKFEKECSDFYDALTI
ncbi:hypothetical protein CBR_g34937 [Chara braunii]|uniref:CCHC-type domain-containing protein n=1 Tax=Chara braunii TaxID=69332 RepID=A0A388LJY4_CHABU|nr:hypothetical protein CBR_g34937 [Chara braunii]|eukprot:GBG82561.1 hypothetical protein CBR_g34937 [Chara braunii]